MHSKRRILLLIPAVSYRAEDFLAAARELDLEVTVGSDHEQMLASSVPGAGLEIDFAAAAQSLAQIEDFARKRPLAAVLGTDDQSVLLAAMVTERLGLRGNPPRAVALTRNKYRLRKRLQTTGLNCPGFALGHTSTAVCEAARRLGYPCVLKPLSLAASQGVIRVDDERTCRQAARRIFRLLATVYEPGHAHRQSVLVEQYLPGAEVALDGILLEGDLAIVARFDKPAPMQGPYFEETIFTTPSRHAPATIARMDREVAAACRALGLVAGPVHAELRLVEQADGSLRPYLLEIAPRSIGGICSRSVRLSAGTSLESIILRALLDGPSPDLRGRIAAGPEDASGVMMIPIPRAGTLIGVQGVEQARSVPGVTGLTITIGPQETLVPLPDGDRYLGFIFARGDRPDLVEQALRAAHAKLAINVS